MSEALIPLPEGCRTALAAIERNPLELPAEVRAHLHACPACAEARVHWLALEEAPHALAPAGYFERLPGRILRKLPTPSRRPGRLPGLLWTAAAGLLLAGAGLGGFWLGRANRPPVVEAYLAEEPGEVQDLVPDTPFQEGEDALAQLSSLPPEEAEAVLARLEASQAGHP